MLCLYIFALVGVQLLNRHGEVKNPSIRLNFDSFTWSGISCFALLTGERWDDIAFDTVDELGSKAAMAFFISLMLIGNLILLRLFMGIFTSAFAQAREEMKEEYVTTLYNL